ncbi:MoaD/ThiS family protein [Wenzhouxiangella sp. AB-CW3]|uniref:MoaD/ThiS family protein n=1 Tax=Wenzhouxiangella sp. AB-CW3 TaxID=2771012 RepID=UPI00168AC5CC|nr:MoaD/ThiS family protein [Wenzhouxiangella sp. AB-CW3]QOC22456.1 MoaD/ThiS family protein [Wenzhouxiangella sp. AB-CW3]
MNDATATDNNVTISIRLFGAFRQFGDDSTVTVTLPGNAQVRDVREALKAHYAGDDNALALLKASAFATDQAVLDDDDSLPEGEPLSILPPVCGG